jgi:iron complex transport system substrate-binding protein
MKNFKFYIFVLVIVSILLSGCAASQEANGVKGVVMVDGLGRSVTIFETPQKIVSLAPSNTELLFAVGAGAQVVGRDEFSDYPEEAKNIASVGGSMGKYSLEQISALQPDLVLAAEINTAEQVKSLEDLGLIVFYLSNPKDMQGLYGNLQTVGKLTGKVKEADHLVSSLQNRVDIVVEAAKVKNSTAVKVFYELDGSDPSKPWTSGKGSFIDVLLSMAGGVNVANDAGEGWIQYSQEALIVANPDVILMGDAAYGVTAESVAARTGWDAISAVQNKRVFAFDDNLVSRPGPRLVDGLEELAKLLNQ